MKLNIIRVILILLLLSTFFIIFNFSSQDAEKSGSVSGKVTETVTSNIKFIQKLEKSEKEKVLDRTEKIIRKIAHFSIYTLVGLLLMGLASTYNLDERKRICIKHNSCFIYYGCYYFNRISILWGKNRGGYITN